jgi:magnesium-transporting ATPase (P-type)
MPSCQLSLCGKTPLKTYLTNWHCFLLQYSFYKNIACFTCQLLFAFYSNFSGMTLYESMFLFLYNTLYTAAPVVVYGLTEQKYPDHTLLEHPELYKKNKGNALMGKRMFFLWLSLGIWHSLCAFFPWVFNWISVETAPIFGHGLTSLGAVVAGAAVTITNLKVLLEARYWSWVLVLVVFWSIGMYQ